MPADGVRANEKVLGKFGLWEARRNVEATGKACFAETAPSHTIGRLGKPFQATLTITHIPSRKAFGQIRIKVGVALRPGVPLELTVGAKKFNLPTNGELAAGAASDNADILAAMKVSQSVTARSVPVTGLRIADTFSLDGFLDALAAIDKECGGEKPLEIPQSADGHYYVTSIINGIATRMLVDTGATVTVVSVADAERAGLVLKPSDYVLSVRTASGIAKAAQVRLREMRIGVAHLEDVPAIVMTTPGNISLLGISTLQQFKSYEVRGGVLTLQW